MKRIPFGASSLLERRLRNVLAADTVGDYISEIFYDILEIGYTEDKVDDLAASINDSVTTFIKQRFSSKLGQLLNKSLTVFIGVTMEPSDSTKLDVFFCKVPSKWTPTCATATTQTPLFSRRQ